MEYKSLGRSGLQVSRLALGTMNFGFVSDESASLKIMDEALGAGINFIDTADVYGGPQSPDMESLYNLNARTIELEVIPACRHYGLGLVPWSPLGGGLLSGVLRKTTTGRRSEARMQHLIERHRSQLEAYEGLCKQLGEEPADVALAWLLHNPIVTAPIIGPRTVEQLTGAFQALKISLSDETLRKLDEIWPGPGGEAPKAYAW
jgi:aryl-alcohol dehydrogenase-like predicted oxidoreductase